MKVKFVLLLMFSSNIYFSYSQCIKKDIKGASFGYIEEQNIYDYTYITLNNSILYIVDSNQQLYYECIIKNDSIEIPLCFIDCYIKLILNYNDNIYSTVSFCLDKEDLDYKWFLGDIYPDLNHKINCFHLKFSILWAGDICYDNLSEYHLYSENILKDIKKTHTLINSCNENPK